jgi:folate-binding protein YgfZ
MRTAAGQATARRPRAFVRVVGPDAADYLQRMVSNDVVALASGESCPALLLTPKARVIATLVVLRRAEVDFLLLTEPELGDVVRAELQRHRFAAKADIESEDHFSYLLLATAPPSAAAVVPNAELGVPAWEVLDEAPPEGLPSLSLDEVEALRIRAGTPRFGWEIDDRVLPAEAGLVESAVSFSKGCYPGQEPIARLEYRGHANRGLRRLLLEGHELPERDAPILHAGREVGRVTSAIRADEGVLALGYVRVEVPEDVELTVGAAAARQFR